MLKSYRHARKYTLLISCGMSAAALPGRFLAYSVAQIRRMVLDCHNVASSSPQKREFTSSANALTYMVGGISRHSTPRHKVEVFGKEPQEPRIAQDGLAD